VTSSTGKKKKGGALGRGMTVSLIITYKEEGDSKWPGGLESRGGRYGRQLSWSRRRSAHGRRRGRLTISIDVHDEGRESSRAVHLSRGRGEEKRGVSAPEPHLVRRKRGRGKSLSSILPDRK